MTLPTDNTFIEKADQEILGKNKLFFGAYLNMANHNAYLIIKDISERLKQEDALDIDAPSDEDNLAYAEIFSKILKKASDKNPKNRPQATIIDKVTNLLIHHFPAFEVFAYEHPFEQQNSYPELLYQKLSTASKLLNDLRNEHSHFYYKGSFDIDTVFSAAQEEITRFPYLTPEDIEELEYYKNDLLEPLTYFKKYGFVFFICTFLEKRYARYMLKEKQLDLIASDKERDATLENFTNYSCRLPRPKLESSVIELDMLNELSRCPKGIHDVLSSPMEKVLLKTDAKDDPNQVPMIRHNDRFPYFALSYFDKMERFPAMRFHIWAGKTRLAFYGKKLGKKNVLRDIQENVTIYARLNDIKADKIPDNWKDKIDVEDSEENKEKAKIQSYSPHYNIHNNRIAIKFIDTQKDELDTENFSEIKSKPQDPTKDKQLKYTVTHALPNAILSTYELQNLFLYDYLYRTYKDQKVLARPADSFIRNYISSFHRFCKDVKSGKIQPVSPHDFERLTEHTRSTTRDLGNREEELEIRKEALQKKKLDNYGLKVKNLPDALREYLLGYKQETYTEIALNKLRGKIQQTKVHYKLATKDDLFLDGKTDLKSGKIGDFLAADIVFLKPLDANRTGKPNNQQFNELQKAIARFHSQKKDVEDFINEELQIKEQSLPHAHPFLYKIQFEEHTDVQSFYIKYLELKIEWLECTKREIQGKSDYLKPWQWREEADKCKQYGIDIKPEGLSDAATENKYGYFLQINTKKGNERNYTNATTRSKANSKEFESLESKSPVILPRGLFNDAIIDAMMKIDEFKGKIKEGDNIVRCLDVLAEGDRQTFYDFERSYTVGKAAPTSVTIHQGANDEYIKNKLRSIKPIIKKLRTQQNAKDAKYKDKKILQNHIKALQAISDNERSIRFIRANDRALFLMIKHIFSEHKSYVVEGSKLTKSINTLPWKLNKVGYEIKENNILNEILPMNIQFNQKNIYTEGEYGTDPLNKLSIKHYGKFRKLLKDKRLSNKKKPGLLNYYTDQNVRWSAINKELEYYDENRDRLLDVIYKFEKAVWENEECREELKENIRLGYINHAAQLKAVGKIVRDFTASKQDQLALLRNKFLHNQIPYTENLKTGWVDNNPEYPLITQALLELAIIEYQNIKKNII